MNTWAHERVHDELPLPSGKSLYEVFIQGHGLLDFCPYTKVLFSSLQQPLSFTQSCVQFVFPITTVANNTNMLQPEHIPRTEPQGTRAWTWNQDASPERVPSSVQLHAQ